MNVDGLECTFAWTAGILAAMHSSVAVRRLTARLEQVHSLLPRLRASLASRRQKVAALSVGISGVSLGSQHFVRLRTFTYVCGVA